MLLYDNVILTWMIHADAHWIQIKVSTQWYMAIMHILYIILVHRGSVDVTEEPAGDDEAKELAEFHTTL